MEKTLQRLGEVDIIPPPGPSKFVAPQTVMYHLDGEAPPWQQCCKSSPALVNSLQNHAFFQESWAAFSVGTRSCIVGSGAAL